MLVTRASLIPFTVGCACLCCLTLCAEPPAAQPAAPAGIPQRYFMDYPIVGRFCQPIRMALAGAARTSVAGRRGNVAVSAVHLRAEQVGQIIDGLKQAKTKLSDADSPLLSE